MAKDSLRLAGDLVPSAYDITLRASPERSDFSGTVVIDFAASGRGSRLLRLHARALTVSRALLDPGGEQEAELPAPQCDDRLQTITWPLAGALADGPHKLAIDFRGELGTNMHGLYLAVDGPERALVSQCEASDARAIFPCFDEPAFKATITWHVVTDRGLEVITNGALLRREAAGENEEAHHFAPTAAISTYLAAVTIGRFVASAEAQVVGKPCRIVCGPGKLDQVHFAAQVTAFVLPWYERYFAARYPFDKLDQVAVPGFDAGAMENVGAIFYRQNLLLMDPETTSWSSQKRIAEVVAHEIAHQWFGNLVTMAWWDDLWLNEAFATWIAFKVSDAREPSWRMWDDFLSGRQAALVADAQASTHPVYQPVNSPAEATELFDVITYEKGCAVLRMVEAHIGEAAFQRGISRYIAAFRGGNASGSDLWRKLAEAADAPVDRLLHGWVTTAGFPQVEAAVQGDTLTISQRRFFADPARAGGPADAALWEVPLTILHRRGGTVRRQQVVLAQRQAEVRLDGSGPVEWATLDPEATGFFRQRRSAALLGALTQSGLGELTPAARITLLDDQWAQVTAGHSAIGPMMDLLAAFAGERDPYVLRALVGRLATVDDALLAARDVTLLGPLALNLFAAELKRLGWQARAGEPPWEAALRASLWGAVGQWTRHPPLLAAARRAVAAEMQRPEGSEANFAHTLIRLAAIDGDLAWARRYLATYQARKRAGSAPDLQARYLYALPSFDSAAVQDMVLGACLDGTIPQEQLRVILGALLGHRGSGLRAWRFLRRHWQRLGPRLGGMGIARLVETTGRLPAARAAEVRAFFADAKVPEAERALRKALEMMPQREALRRREAAVLRRWLRRYPTAAPA